MNIAPLLLSPNQGQGEETFRELPEHFANDTPIDQVVDNSLINAEPYFKAKQRLHRDYFGLPTEKNIGRSFDTKPAFVVICRELYL